MIRGRRRSRLTHRRWGGVEDGVLGWLLGISRVVMEGYAGGSGILFSGGDV